MNNSSNDKINISITKSMLHSLCAARILDYHIWADDLTADHQLLSLSILQDGVNTVYDFSNEQSSSKILETLIYLDMYFMQENSEALLSFCKEVAL